MKVFQYTSDKTPLVIIFKFAQSTKTKTVAETPKPILCNDSGLKPGLVLTCSDAQHVQWWTKMCSDEWLFLQWWIAKRVKSWSKTCKKRSFIKFLNRKILYCTFCSKCPVMIFSENILCLTEQPTSASRLSPHKLQIVANISLLTSLRQSTKLRNSV